MVVVPLKLMVVAPAVKVPLLIQLPVIVGLKPLASNVPAVIVKFPATVVATPNFTDKPVAFTVRFL